MPNFEIKDDYLIMTPEEGYSFEYYKRAIREAAELCKQNKIHKLIADNRTINKDIPMFERFELGVEVAKIMGNNIKTAIILPPQRINKFGENAAVNRGGRVLVTDSMERAIEWLKEN